MHRQFAVELRGFHRNAQKRSLLTSQMYSTVFYVSLTVVVFIV